jgi:hypothetical protein
LLALPARREGRHGSFQGDTCSIDRYRDYAFTVWGFRGLSIVSTYTGRTMFDSSGCDCQSGLLGHP